MLTARFCTTPGHELLGMNQSACGWLLLAAVIHGFRCSHVKGQNNENRIPQIQNLAPDPQQHNEQRQRTECAVAAGAVQNPEDSNGESLVTVPTMTTLSSAELVVREAASRIGLTDSPLVSDLCASMSSQYVIEAWQLPALDSAQWKELGAPIGLAAAIRMTASPSSDSPTKNVRVKFPNTSDDGLLGTFLTSQRFNSAAPPTRAISRQGTVTNANYSENLMVQETTAEQEDTNQEALDTKDVSQQDTERGTKRRTHQRNRKQPPRSIVQVMRTFPDCTPGRPFPIRDTFYRALLHSKTGHELKAHSLFVMELSVVVSGLLTGAAAELWGAFPLGQEDVPELAALIFNCLACAALMVQFICTVGWILFLSVAAAVSPDKYGTFAQQTRDVQSRFWFLVEVGALCFAAAIGVLFTSTVWTITSNDAVRYVVGLGFPAAAILPIFLCVHNFISYVGRVAFHGMLLFPSPPTREPKSHNPPGRLAKRMERERYETFHENLERDENVVLDICASVASIFDYGNETEEALLVEPQDMLHNRPSYFARDYAVPAYNMEADQTGAQRQNAA